MVYSTCIRTLHGGWWYWALSPLRLLFVCIDWHWRLGKWVVVQSPHSSQSSGTRSRPILEEQRTGSDRTIVRRGTLEHRVKRGYITLFHLVLRHQGGITNWTRIWRGRSDWRRVWIPIKRLVSSDRGKSKQLSVSHRFVNFVDTAGSCDTAC